MEFDKIINNRVFKTLSMQSGVTEDNYAYITILVKNVNDVTILYKYRKQISSWIAEHEIQNFNKIWETYLQEYKDSLK